MDYSYNNDFYGGDDDDVRLEHVGGEDDNYSHGGYNEFMVGGEDEEDRRHDDHNQVMGGSCCDGGDEMPNEPKYGGYSGDVHGGYSGGAFFASCGVAFLIVIAVLIVFKWMTSKSKAYRKHRPVPRALPAPVRHVDVFDNVMTPASYFDYDQHGMQYINWTAN
jgi:hypothetical protein